MSERNLKEKDVDSSEPPVIVADYLKNMAPFKMAPFRVRTRRGLNKQRRRYQKYINDDDNNFDTDYSLAKIASDPKEFKQDPVIPAEEGVTSNFILSLDNGKSDDNFAAMKEGIAAAQSFETRYQQKPQSVGNIAALEQLAQKAGFNVGDVGNIAEFNKLPDAMQMRILQSIKSN